MHNKEILRTENLHIGYKHKKQKNILLSNININICKGELICLLGPNGIGKSTLMRTISGLQESLDGDCYINNESIKTLNIKSISKLLSVVLTEKPIVGKLSVYEIVSLGRHPHTSWMGHLSQADLDKIEWALSQVGMLGFSHRHISELSDGEQQRVMIAKALAQDTDIIMLDEPTAHLDLPNRVETMLLLRNLAQNTNKAILISTHELDLALQCADKIWLMSKNKAIKVGTPEDLVLQGYIDFTFSSKSFYFDKNTGNFVLNYNNNKDIFMSGDKVLYFWTKRALSRSGFNITDNINCPIKIHIEHKQWLISNNNRIIICNNIENLLSEINKINCNKTI